MPATDAVPRPAQSADQPVRRSVHAVGNSRWLEVLARAGFIGYGVVHLAVAWVTVQIAAGRQQEEGDQSGAVQLLERQPFGRFLLIFMAVGLAAMAVWQLILAAVGHREERGLRLRAGTPSPSRPAERLASLGRTVVYAAVAWTAARVVLAAPNSSAEQQEKATAGVLAHPAGRWLVALAALGVLALGIGLAVHGLRRSFEKRLRMAQMSRRVRRIATRLGQVGYLAKGVAYGIVGVLVGQAALSRDAARSRGLDGALHTLAGKAYGTVLLIVIAVGFAAFGVYCFFQSRYRRV